MDFETLNRLALKDQESLYATLNEENADAYSQNIKMVEALYARLEPHVKEVSAATIEHHGELQTYEIDFFDFIDGYEKTEYITSNFVDKVLPDRDSVSCMISHLSKHVEKRFRENLPAFYIYICPSASMKLSTGEFTYTIKIKAQYNKEFYKSEHKIYD